jgi:hypothetical protein
MFVGKLGIAPHVPLFPPDSCGIESKRLGMLGFVLSSSIFLFYMYFVFAPDLYPSS